MDSKFKEYLIGFCKELQLDRKDFDIRETACNGAFNKIYYKQLLFAFIHPDSYIDDEYFRYCLKKSKIIKIICKLTKEQ
jgi:hypothetical protein